MEIESEEDDWCPNPNGTILDKKIVNFTSKINKKKDKEVKKNL